MVLGHLGGLLAVSFVLIRDIRFIAAMSLVYTGIALAVSFGVPVL